MRNIILGAVLSTIIGAAVGPAFAQGTTTPAPSGMTCKEGEKYDPVIKSCSKVAPR